MPVKSEIMRAVQEGLNSLEIDLVELVRRMLRTRDSTPKCAIDQTDEGHSSSRRLATAGTTTERPDGNGKLAAPWRGSLG